MSRTRRDHRPHPGQQPEGPKVTFRLTEKQLELAAAIHAKKPDGGPLHTLIGFGGAIRGTKTFGSIANLVILCARYPRSRWAIVRQDLPTIRKNVLPSFEKVRDTTGGWIGELNYTSWTYTCANGSKIILFPEGIEKDPDLNRWKGLEVNGFLLEEANELSEKTFNKAIERAGSWIVPPTQEQMIAMDAARQAGDPEWKLHGPQQPPPLVICTFNPADNWVRSTFYDPFKLGTLKPPVFFLPTTIRDNPYVDQAYLDSLEQLKERDYDTYARFVLGEWGAISEPNQLIATQWLINAREAEFVPGPPREACDVARFGDDTTVYARLNGNALVEIEVREHWDTEQVADRALERMMHYEIAPEDYRVDSVALGSGVYDKMRRRGYKVYGFEAGRRAVPRPVQEGVVSLYKFKDLRSQAWWEFREKVRLGEIRLNVMTERLRKHLTGPRYEILADRTIAVEPKEITKKRIGESPDEGDAVVMAYFDPPSFLYQAHETLLPPTISQRARA